MAVSITTFTPNTKAQSSQVNANFTNIVSAIGDVSRRAFTFGLLDLISVGDEQGMKYIASQNLTVINVWYKLDVGTATLRLQKDTTDIKTSLSATTSVQNTTSFDATVITAGQMITLDVTAASGDLSGVYVTLECQVTTIV